MTHASWFSGIGGFDLGFDLAGIETVSQCENNEFCRKVLETHWPGVKRPHDIRECDGRDYPANVYSGGDPCQRDSAASIGHKATATAWGGEFIRVIAEGKPTWVIRENPTRIRTDALWPPARFAACLEELGYTCLLCDMQCAALTGFSRKRNFVLGGTATDIGRLRELLPEQPCNGRYSASDEASGALPVCLTGHRVAYSPRDNYIIEATRHIRILDRHERLGAQGFPEDWLPEGASFAEVVAVTGNAVPIQVARWWGERIMAVGCESYRTSHRTVAEARI